MSACEPPPIVQCFPAGHYALRVTVQSHGGLMLTGGYCTDQLASVVEIFESLEVTLSASSGCSPQQNHAD